MKKQNNAPNNALASKDLFPDSPFESHPIQEMMPSSPLSKGIISICALLLLILTMMSSSTLLSSPIHPIGLLLGILIPAYFFLLFALIRQHSLFSTLLFFLQKQFTKLQSQFTEKSSQKSPTIFQTDPKMLSLLAKVIMHSAWMIIFIGLLIGLFFQFTLKQYQFHLYSTLFPYESGLYLQIIEIFNKLPSLFFNIPVSEDLIARSLQGHPSPADNAIWAQWILLMISIYGLLPRIILLLFAFYQYQRYQKLSAKKHEATSSHSTVLDSAVHRPISERAPKTITTGEGAMQIALDFAYPLPNGIRIINHRSEFTELKNQLTQTPLATLTLYIDSSLTPDRSLLRRIYTLLNCAINSTVILVEPKAHSRHREWQQKITPNLEVNEQIQTEKLSSIH